MLTDELKEKKQRFLKEVQQGFVQLVRQHPLVFVMLKSYVAETILLLQDGKYEHAFWPLRSSYECLVRFKEYSYAKFLVSLLEAKHQKDTTAFWSGLASSTLYRGYVFQYALRILDLGLFAFRLEPSFLYLHDIAPRLWESRKDFQPHLSGALRAAYYFLCFVEAGRKPEEALSAALEVRNELYETFGDTRIYQFPRYAVLGELLSPEAVAKLKQILLDTLKGRQGHAK